MKLVLFTHVVHTKYDGKVYAYGPYVREMNLWLKDSDQLIIVSPLSSTSNPQAIDASFDCQNIRFLQIPAFSVIGIWNTLRTVLLFPLIALQTFRGLCSPGLLHFRLPGNLGLIATIMQILFPWRKKIFKYAGNWDPNSNQPWSYRLQRRITTNPFLTKKAKVLVYGKKPQDADHIIDFYTATYGVSEMKDVSNGLENFNQPIRLLFVGFLHAGKRPMLAIEVLQLLLNNHIKCELLICGDGPLKNEVTNFIQNNELADYVKILGGISRQEVAECYRKSHFLILASKSEGWPKAVAEAMWWGCVPIATEVSCVPQMLDYGNRGLIQPPISSTICESIMDIVRNPSKWQQMRMDAVTWSRQFTLERMQSDIERLIDENNTSH